MRVRTEAGDYEIVERYRPAFFVVNTPPGSEPKTYLTKSQLDAEIWCYLDSGAYRSWARQVVTGGRT